MSVKKSDLTNAPRGFWTSRKAFAIVQARLGSERFPGKMLADLCGKPMLAHVTDRLKKCQTLTNVVVATPDKELAQFAYDHGAFGYLDSGDENNVLLRYLKAAGWCGARLVVRITGDCPLVDPKLVDDMVCTYLSERVDMVTNVFRRSYPKGMDIEVVHTNTLKRIYHFTDDPLYLEHVTLFSYENPALFRIKNVSAGGRDWSWMQLSVDTPRDLDRVAKLVSTLSDNAGVVEIVEKYEEMYG